MNFPLVSVVITTKNEEKNIENCLKSLLTQSYPSDKLEIIVVDNNSTDRTKEVVRAFKQSTLKLYKLSNFQLFNWGPERSAQRNFGAKQAKGEYYLYLDADMTLSPNVIEECVDKFIKLESCKVHKESKLSTLKTLNFKTGGLVGLYIPEIVMGDSFWSKVRRFERSFYNATVIDCVRFVRVKDFLAVQGFDETMSGPEDWDFDKKIRARGKVDIIKSPIYHNEGEFNLKNYLKKKAYYIQSFDKYIAKWGKNDPDIKKQLGFYYRFIGVFIENCKWKKLIKHPILTLGMFTLRFLVGFNYLISKNKQDKL